MRFKILSSVCSENCRRDSAPTKTLNKKVSSSSLRLERNLSSLSFFLIFLKYTLLLREREISREMFNTFYKTFMVRFITREGQRRARTFFAFFLLGG